MPTYAYSILNRLRSPSGAVGEPPDGPGAIAALAADIDAYLGNGGAETAATVAAMQAIPTNRCFKGKLVYVTATDTVYRYVGSGGVTAIVTDAPTTAVWLAWSKPATSYIPAVNNLGWTTFTARVALWGITDGIFWTTVAITHSDTNAPSNSTDTALQSPSPVIGGLGRGDGQFNAAGSTATNAQSSLACHPVGAFGASTSQIRVRGRWVSATGAPLRENILGTVFTTGANGDSINFDFRGPSALYA